MVEAAKLRVVVAEDDDAVLELVRTRLELAGYAVSCARNGLVALELIQSVQPAGLILDLNMPVLDGFGVLAALRYQKDCPPVPTLVLTARHASEDVKRCLSLGAKDFLAKPFKDKDLLARAARLVRVVPSTVQLATKVESYGTRTFAKGLRAGPHRSGPKCYGHAQSSEARLTARSARRNGFVNLGKSGAMPPASA